MNSTIPRRHTVRLRGYDYSSEGLYFVTICTDRRASLFGEIADGKMRLNEVGKIVDATWAHMFRFSEVSDPDTWIVMPNHLHGIVAITDIAGGGSRTAPTRKPLGRQLGAFKTVSTRRINEIRRTPGAVIWQRSFYEHIIGDERSIERIDGYIRDNPGRWESDPENPVASNPERRTPWR
jgi:REP-associated tyrosine transposase